MSKIKVCYIISEFNFIDARVSDTSKATKARIEKKGNHKLGQGGYLKLAARIVIK